MKKEIAFLLAAALTLSLAACGGGSSELPEETTMTKEEMAEAAIELSSDTLGEIEENIAKGAEYKNSYCIISGYIEAIHTDYCEVAPFYMNEGTETIGPDFLILNAYLPTDELASLEVDTQITIIGHISDIGEEAFTLTSAAGNVGQYALGMEMTRKAITMDSAFIYE